MEFLADLWLPILLSSVFVFVASSVIHMVIPIHKGDLQKLPKEDDFRAAVRGLGIPPGDYVFPCAGSMKEMGNPEMLEKYRQGPVGIITIVPAGPPNMGKSLLQWFLYSLLISVFVAYIAHLALGAGADYRRVFRIAGATAVLGYAFSGFSDSIWKGQSWRTSLKFVFDGLIYGLLTGGTFGWLWPQPA